MNKNAIEAQKKFNVDVEKGLCDSDVESNLKKYGPNELKIKKKKNFFIKFISQFKDPMLILLLITAIVSYVLAGLNANGVTTAFAAKTQVEQIESIIQWVEPTIILIIILINTLFGAIQEWKAEKSMDSLKSMTTPIAKVMRNNQFDQIKSTQIVPGDILILESGDTIPADGVIVESSSFKVVEAVLTGESLPVEKNEDFEFDEKTSMADKLNYVYSGTNVINGRAKVIVTNTGMNTEVGKIASMLNNEKDAISPLEKKVAFVGKVLSIVAFVFAVLIFLLYILYANSPELIKNTWLQGFKIAISIGIAIVPEGLLAILTIVLALGIKRMISYNALIKKISSVETLGSVSIICSDKTGTLTQNKMSVVEIFTEKSVYNESNFNDCQQIIEYGMLCNDTKIDDEILVGDPTETAIVELGKKNKIDLTKLNKDFKRIEELPFDSDRKLMTTIHEIKKDEYLIITKGAPDNLFNICKNKIDKFIKANDSMSKKALRVLAIAIKKVKKLPKNVSFSEIEKDLELVGLYGIIDPPRLEVKEAIQTCLQAGIRPIMITGDHINTANAIAKELGILNDGEQAISGIELSALSDDELIKNIKNYSVYARVSPEDKIRVVKAWQANNQYVAMTGDGINDAPALKAANIGCAMGITGTEVSKDAADIILMDDNFTTIVHAVKQGRGIIDNIKKIMITLFTTNLSNLLTLVFGIFVFFFSPLTSIQILWINLVTESFPGIALGMKSPEDKLMTIDSKSKQLIDSKMIFRIVISGILFSSIALLMFYLGASSVVGFDFWKTIDGLKRYDAITDSVHKNIVYLMQIRGSTLAFMVIAFSQSFNAFNTFSSKNIFSYKWNEIKYVFYSFLISLSLTLLVVLIPTLNNIFNNDIYSFGVKNDIVDLTSIPQEMLLNISTQNYFWLPILTIVLVFIPTIIFEISKLIYNNKRFSNYVQTNKFLKMII